MMVILGAAGAFYGFEVSSTPLTEIILGAVYGFVGVCIAVPLAFAINVTRHWIWLPIFVGMRFATLSGKRASIAQAVPNPISESTAMKHKRQFEINRTVAREAATIGAMIADMRRAVELLDCDVGTEEERIQIKDRADAQYPMLARHLAARRDNLKVTIATLEARLSLSGVNVPTKITSMASPPIIIVRMQPWQGVVAHLSALCSSRLGNVKSRTRLRWEVACRYQDRMGATPKQTFDVYRNKAKPALRLATTPGAGVPRHFAAKDWARLKEPSLLHSDAAKDVAVKGYCYFQVIEG
jgi:hypothetical protein